MIFEDRTSLCWTRRPRRRVRTVTSRTDDGNKTLREQSTENGNACKAKGKVKQVSARKVVTITADKYQTLIDTLRGGGEGGAAGTAGAAAKEGPMEPCALGKDRLKRPMIWTNWHRVAENKMRLMGINDNVRRINYLRRCAGAELTKIWEKEERMGIEANREGEAAVPAHTYEQVVEDTMMTLLSDAWSMQVTVLKRDQEGPGTSGIARKRNVRHNKGENDDLDGEGRGHEVQGHDIDKYTYEAEGAGHQRMYKDKGAGRQDMYKAEGAGHRGIYKAEGTGRQGGNKDEGPGHQDTYKAKGAGRQVCPRTRARGFREGTRTRVRGARVSTRPRARGVRACSRMRARDGRRR